jgi:hypothetical protein
MTNDDKEKDLSKFMSSNFAQEKTIQPLQIKYPSTLQTRNHQIKWLENWFLGYIKWPNAPKFELLPENLKDLCKFPSELPNTGILYLVSNFFQRDRTRPDATRGKFKNLVYKSFNVWCYEQDPYRFVFIQGEQNINNFYLLGTFSEIDSMNEYTNFLDSLQASYVEQNKIIIE